MEWILLVAWIPFVLGFLAAVVWMVMRRHGVSLSGRLAALAVVGGLLPVLVAVWYTATGVMVDLFVLLGPDVFMVLQDARFIAPLVAGILGILILSIPGRRPRLVPAADIARRTAFTFLPRGWVITLAAVTVGTVVVTCAAGLLSTGDDDTFSFPIGTMTVGTTIYGWHASAPALILLIILLAAGWTALWLIARPPVADTRDVDIAARRTRSRNIAAVITGGIAFHLAVILQSLAGTASLTGTVPSATAGDITVHSPFAALAPVLQASSVLATCVAVAVCLTVTLTAVPEMNRARTSVETAS
ncbi:hypothetical protein [Microbacterium rhizosphaerae]|uniref:Cytochrome c oxidase assembly protein n=1 Tax=Microbacterium rhizosphaerae TaxID=1678237 RepID=A0ABZ0SNK3_9MICO|nr:hypothetical protein [Microbacterium rhizosphaerae]WPR90926.1 hypothetical protein SM116_06440 [Microbacterium rhizosphaerae]